VGDFPIGVEPGGLNLPKIWNVMTFWRRA